MTRISIFLVQGSSYKKPLENFLNIRSFELLRQIFKENGISVYHVLKIRLFTK